jgi:hypothetical protein
MTRRGPYPKRPPAQTRIPEFYFRGGDILLEREHLTDEFRTALANFRRAEGELAAVECQLQTAIDTLHEREGYSNALASFLDADTEGNLAEQDVKRRLPKVESDIRKAELDLQAARAIHLPAVSAALQKEKAYLLIELKRTQEALDQTNQQQIVLSRKLARVICTPRYQLSLDMETKVVDLARKHIFLKSLVDRTKKNFDKTRPVVAVQTAEARIERAALLKQLDVIQMLERVQDKAKRRPPKWSSQVYRLLCELDDLNRTMADLAMAEEEQIDLEALREKYQDGGEEDPGPTAPES